MRILCVEHDIITAQDTFQHLQARVGAVEWSHTTALATTIGLLETARAHGAPYDILLVDLMLPGETSGLLGLAQIRATFPALLIVATTPLVVVQKALAVGARTIIATPQQREDVLLALLKEPGLNDAHTTTPGCDYLDAGVHHGETGSPGAGASA